MSKKQTVLRSVATDAERILHGMASRKYVLGANNIGEWGRFYGVYELAMLMASADLIRRVERLEAQTKAKARKRSRKS